MSSTRPATGTPRTTRRSRHKGARGRSTAFRAPMAPSSIPRWRTSRSTRWSTWAGSAMTRAIRGSRSPTWPRSFATTTWTRSTCADWRPTTASGRRRSTPGGRGSTSPWSRTRSAASTFARATPSARYATCARRAPAARPPRRCSHASGRLPLTPEDDPAVQLRPLRDLVRAGDGGYQRAKGVAQHAHPVGLGAQLQERLLGLRRELHPGRYPVGVLRLDLRGGRLARDPLHQLRERLPRGRSGLGIVIVGFLACLDRLDLSRGVVGLLKSLQDLERLLSGDDDVHAPILEALQHLGHPRRAPDPVRGSLGVPKDDPERLRVLQAVTDHPLVALLEDVQRQQLPRQDHHGKLEDRKLDPFARYGSILGAACPSRASSWG